MRGRQLLHLDLKSPNVLLCDKNCLVAKIADLGLSKYLVEGSLLEITRVIGAHASSRCQRALLARSLHRCARPGRLAH